MTVCIDGIVLPRKGRERKGEGERGGREGGGEGGGRERERGRERETERQRETERDRERQTDRQTDRDDYYHQSYVYSVHLATPGLRFGVPQSSPPFD